MKKVLTILIVLIGITGTANSQCDLKMKEQLIAKSKADGFTYIKDFSFEFDEYTKSKFCNLVLQRNTNFRIYLGSSSIGNPEIEFSLLNYKKAELKKVKLRNEIISLDFQPDSSGIFEFNLNSLNNDRVCTILLLSFKKLPPSGAKPNPVNTVNNSLAPVYLVTDEKPEFKVGDDNAFMKWVEENYKVPEIVNQKNLRGNVYVNIIVDTEGKVTDVKITRGVDYEVDVSVAEFIKTCPVWEKPGKLKGKPVRTYLLFPVTIKPRAKPN